jgi:hypothetical protein
MFNFWATFSQNRSVKEQDYHEKFEEDWAKFA